MQTVDHRAWQKLPERFTEFRRRRILGGGDAQMVAVVVLDVEVAVQRLRQSDFGEPPLDVLALVPQFVRGIDADAADDAHSDGQTDPLRCAEWAVGPQVTRGHQAGVLQREEEVDAPPVVLVLVECCESLVGWIAAIDARELVDQRQRDAHDHQPECPECAGSEE